MIHKECYKCKKIYHKHKNGMIKAEYDYGYRWFCEPCYMKFREVIKCSCGDGWLKTYDIKKEIQRLTKIQNPIDEKEKKERQEGTKKDCATCIDRDCANCTKEG